MREGNVFTSVCLFIGGGCLSLVPGNFRRWVIMLGPRSLQGMGMPGPRSLPRVGGYTRGREWVYVEGTPLPEGDH